MQNVVYQSHPPFIQNKLIITSSRHSVCSCAALGIIAQPPPRDAAPSSSLSSCLRMVHAQIIKSPDKSTPADNLIQQYAESGDNRSAALLVLIGRPRLSGHLGLFAQLSKYKSLLRTILEVFSEFLLEGIVFDRTTFIYVLIVCTSVSDLLLGVEVHTHLLKRGFIFYVDVQLALMRFYHRCLGIHPVNQLFDEMPEQRRHVLVSNEAIKMNLMSKRWMRAFQLFRYSMHMSLAKSVSTTFVIMLQACAKLKALKEGKQIHGYILRSGLELSVSIGNALINMYAKNEELQLAVEVFDLMEDINLTSWNSIISANASLGNFNDAWDYFITLRCSDVQPDIVTWNCLLSGLIRNGSYVAGLTIFHKMQLEGFHPNSISVTCALQSVIKMGLLNCGREIHGYAIKHSLDCDVYVGTSLVDMYVKSDCLATARKVLFSNMKTRNNFAWNALLSGYSFKGLFQDAENLLNQMVDAGVEPDLVTWNSLVSGYSMSGKTDKALSILKRSGLVPNAVSWTALISGCSQNGRYCEAIEFFRQMQTEGVEPNAGTISCLLRTCGGLSILQQGKEIHCFTIKNDMINDTYVATAVIDMYNKSGNLSSGREVFESTCSKSLATWNCMMMGFATYGCGKEAILLFQEMCREGVGPDAVTFTALLSGCKNSSMVTDGWRFFDSMSRDYNITPTIEHYSCMVDMLGRASYVDEAWDFIQTMPFEPDATVWGALLCASRIHKNLYYAEIASKHLFELEPQNCANYILMVNLYSMLKQWDDVERVKDLMRRRKIKDGKVWSWIWVDGKVHYFFSTEEEELKQDPHPQAGEIYFELYQMVSEIKELGYVADTNCVYQRVENDKEKEKVLLTHTEKMAIAFGLLKNKDSTSPIRVVKSSRVCNDCHNAAKYISLAKNRHIFIKDGVRFHHFRDGTCSCNDCW